jgi:hypothetical protein
VNKDAPAFDKMLRLLTGVKILDVDPEKSVVQDRSRQLQQFIADEAIPTKRNRQLRDTLLKLRGGNNADPNNPIRSQK